jgi:MFS family permease
MTPIATEPKTHWVTVWLATLAGLAVALQVGKAAATLPLIRAEFSSGLTLLAIYIAAISVVAATVGLGFGGLSRRIGVRRAGVAGLVIVAIGSAGGAMAESVAMLLITRLLEAVGFALTVTAMPAFIQTATRPSDRSVALGIWATWLPAGIAVMMAVAYFFMADIGWRGLFWFAAFVPALTAGLMLVRTAPTPAVPTGPIGPGLVHLMRRNVILTTAIFIAFSSSNIIIMAFLPTILVDNFAMSSSAATGISFLGSVVLILVNVLAGWILKRGLDGRRLYLVAFLGMLVLAGILLISPFPVPVRLAAAVGFSFCAGFPPAIVWISIPVLARQPEEVPLLSGLFFQGAGVGQIIGPVLAGWVVDTGNGWPMAFWVIAGLILFGIGSTLGLTRRLEAPSGV